MCGICGFYDYRAANSPMARCWRRCYSGFVTVGQTIKGLIWITRLAFGMRRLSIIDLAGGKQPIYNEAGDIVIVFNGEIYNYIELCVMLRQRDPHVCHLQRHRGNCSSL